MKKILLLTFIIPALCLSSCKKGEVAKPLSLVGLKFKDGGFEQYGLHHERVLEFITETQVNYYELYSPSPDRMNIMYLSDVAKLAYTIDDPYKIQPSIHITGLLNGPSGKTGYGGKADWTLIRTPRSFQALQALDMDSVHYTQQETELITRYRVFY
ncbi:hypothetical protein [Mucilaginibacter sp. CSA2-8R]|uniref:hypothetical protein n=1 Tax=Mucilaginibacter sp. CSA2-8R TaxID=3141542 RepID=UPI00315CEA2E